MPVSSTICAPCVHTHSPNQKNKKEKLRQKRIKTCDITLRTKANKQKKFVQRRKKRDIAKETHTWQVIQ